LSWTQSGSRRSDRENVLTGNNGGLEVQVGATVATDTLVNLGSNVCGTDTICP